MFSQPFTLPLHHKIKVYKTKTIIMRQHVQFSAILFSALCMASCSTTKFVPKDQYLLDKAEVKTLDKRSDIDMSRMKQCIEQHGNSRWFSIFKIPLATYSLAGRDSSRWINRTLKSMGEAPVVFDSISARHSMENLSQELRNQGYLGAKVSLSTRTHGRKINALYTLHPGQPYHIAKIRYDIADHNIRQILGDIEHTGSLHSGQTFNVEHLKAERNRITEILNDNGYYKFNKDYISFKADTVQGGRAIDLTLILRPYPAVADGTHPKYTIGNVNFKSDNPNEPDIKLRQNVLKANTFIEKGDYYSNSKLKQTYNHFGRLQAVKYTNISFNEQQDRQLDCNVQISTNKPHTISFQPEGTNTAGDLGAAASLTYQNRNLFHGAEVLSMELRGAFEAIKGLEGYSNSNFEEYSAQASLTFPRFIAPFLSPRFRRRITATSEVALLYDLQNRPEYHRRVLSLAWRYKWNDTNHHDRYQIDLLDLNYVFMPWISNTFRHDYLEDATNRNAILRYNYEDLFIMKWGLRYSYNNGRWAIKANIETAGNLLDLGSNVLHAKKDEQGRYTLFRIAYAQYAKFDFDYSRNIQLDYDNNLVLHAGFGVAYPYGNSTILPFEKRYFSGGANSVRGWSVRGLGPGKFQGKDGKIDFINQTGDIKLDLNIEYRAKLFWKFAGAAFIDAGNIWTLRAYADQPGGQFKINEFWKQIAVAYGLGLRLNFDYFVLRFDLGMKAINPAYNTSREHYPIVHPNFSRDCTFHFAVGLPF